MAVHKKTYFPNTSEGLESEINDNFEKRISIGQSFYIMALHMIKKM